MKKIFGFFLLLFPLFMNAQDTKTGTNEMRSVSTFVGINAGFDMNYNAFRQDPYTRYPLDFYEITPHYNFGVDLSISYGRIRPRVEVKFVKLSYGMNWNDFNSTFDYTITKLYNMDFNLHLDYRLFTIKKFDFFISPAFKSEFVLTSKNIRHDLNGDTDDALYKFVGEEYPRNILAVAISSIFKYRITEMLGLTLIPEYTYFGRKFVRNNHNAYQRISLNMGLELEF